MPYRRRSMLLAEIARQCRFAMRAYGFAAAAAVQGDDEALWPAIDEVLGAASRLHQLLWPAAENAALCAVEVRAALAIGPDSPLARPDLRSLSDLAVLVDEWTLRPRGAARRIDRERSEVHYYGLAFELAPLLGSIAGIEGRAVQEARQMRQMV